MAFTLQELPSFLVHLQEDLWLESLSGLLSADLLYTMEELKLTGNIIPFTLHQIRSLLWVFLLSSSGKGLPSPTISASLFLIYLIINGTDFCHFKYLVLEESVPPNHPVFPYPGILGLPVFISTFY